VYVRDLPHLSTSPPEGHVSVAAGLGHCQDEATVLEVAGGADGQGRHSGIDLAPGNAARGAGQIHQGLRQTKGVATT